MSRWDVGGEKNGRFSDEGLFKLTLRSYVCGRGHVFFFGWPWKSFEIVIGACFLIDTLKVAKFQWEVFSRFCFFDGNEREVFLKIQVTRVEGFLHSRCVCYARWGAYLGFWYCWWVHKIREKPPRIIRFSQLFMRFLTIPGGWEWDFFHQQYHW